MAIPRSNLRSVWLALALLAIWPFTIHAQALGQALPSFDEALDRYSALTALPARIQFKVSEEGPVTYSDRPGRIDRQLDKMTLSKDGERIDVKHETFHADASGVFPSIPRNTQRFVVSADQMVAYQICEGETLGLVSIPEDAVIARDHALWLATGSSHALDGYISTDGYGTNIVQVMRQGWNHEIFLDRSTGTPLCVLKADTPRGQHQLWLDPQRDFQPVRIIVSKTGSDILYDRPLPQRELVRDVITVDSIRFDKVGTVSIGVGCNIRHESTSKDGSIKTISSICRRYDIQLDPVFGDPASFHIDLPDGTPAAYDRLTGLHYEWRQGQVRPVMDPSFAAGIDGAITHLDPFPRQSHNKSIWVIVGTVILLFLSAAAVLLLRGRGKFAR